MSDNKIGDAISVLMSGVDKLQSDSKDKKERLDSQFKNDKGFRFQTIKEYALKDSWLVESEAFSLLLNLHPLTYSSLRTPYFPRIRKLSSAIKSSEGINLHILNSEEKSINWRVKPKHFIEWCGQKEIDVPADVYSAVMKDQKHMNNDLEFQKTALGYNTPLLDIVFEVIKEFWSGKEISSAPAKDWMIDHLIEKYGISKNDATAIDAVTRHPERKKGGHIKR
mgnify:CR=1 FL=1